MKELSNYEVLEVNGGFSTSGMVEAGFHGAVAGGGFGATVGGSIGAAAGGIGAIPGAAVIGFMGAGIGFLSGMVSYALAQK